jgi:hypothetical protein
VRVGPEDDARREPPPDDPWWAESFAFGVGPSGDGLGACSVIVLLPHQRRALYVAAVVAPDRPLLSVVDVAQGLPARGLRLRNGNLWVDHVCDEPLRQWTIMNETYAVALECPTDALGRAYGEPTPVAFDLEWYADGDPNDVEPAGYRIDGRVHGLVELRDGPVELDDVPGCHEHRWGRWPFPAPTTGRPDGLEAPALLVGPDGPVPWWCVLGVDGWWFGGA